MSPVIFGLRMNLRIAVHLACRREQKLGLDTLGQAEHVDRAHHTCFDRLDRVVLVVRW